MIRGVSNALVLVARDRNMIGTFIVIAIVMIAIGYFLKKGSQR